MLEINRADFLRKWLIAMVFGYPPRMGRATSGLRFRNSTIDNAIPARDGQPATTLEREVPIRRHLHEGGPGEGSRGWSVANARSASCTVSLTLSVPLTMCDELTRYRPGEEVRIGGRASE